MVWQTVGRFKIILLPCFFIFYLVHMCISPDDIKSKGYAFSYSLYLSLCTELRRTCHRGYWSGPITDRTTGKKIKPCAAPTTTNAR